MQNENDFFRGITNPMSDNEMRNVRGREANGLEAETEVSNVVRDAKPCEKSGCNGPNGAAVIGGLCCLLPCNGIFGTYGYGIVSGMSRCPWV